MFSLKGTLKVIGKEQQISDKFKKRDFVLVDNSSQYPQFISFQITQDKVNLLDTLNEGEEVTVYFNLRGREWTSPQNEVKYFNTLEAWKIEGGQSTGMGVSQNIPAASLSATPDDDLPF
jgi:hypothetical protein